jgi:phage terminase large subunit-like protein
VSKARPRGGRTNALPVAERYVRDVLAGRIVAGVHVRNACARHRRDLRTARARGFYFDRKRAEHALRFFGYLRHWKGAFAGQPFVLAPWQQFIVWSLFGWRRRADGTRRFRIGWVEIARKNGKTTFAAGIALYCFVCDREPGAEVYSAATKKDQARITFSARRRSGEW